MVDTEFEQKPKEFELRITDNRGVPKPPKPERHGKVSGFVPSRDRVLVKRLPPATEDGVIVRADIGIELAERGFVVAVGPCEYGAPPVGAIADFSKYGAQEKRFDDDEGPNTYAIVWIDDVTGWHIAPTDNIVTVYYTDSTEPGNA
jgi:co-chaperonin GroES (HSP10)